MLILFLDDATMYVYAVILVLQRSLQSPLQGEWDGISKDLWNIGSIFPLHWIELNYIVASPLKAFICLESLTSSTLLNFWQILVEVNYTFTQSDGMLFIKGNTASYFPY
jgi:hypothetical protein